MGTSRALRDVGRGSSYLVIVELGPRDPKMICSLSPAVLRLAVRSCFFFFGSVQNIGAKSLTVRSGPEDSQDKVSGFEAPEPKTSHSELQAIQGAIQSAGRGGVHGQEIFGYKRAQM